MCHFAIETHIISGTFLIRVKQEVQVQYVRSCYFNFDNQSTLSGDLLVLKSRKQANLYIGRETVHIVSGVLFFCRDCEQ